MCTVLLPPGDNPIAVNKYIISINDATNNDLFVINYSSICFGRVYAHHQETRTAYHCLWFSTWLRQHPLHNAHISLPESPEPWQLQPGQKTTGSDTQSALLMMGVKTPWDMLRNNRLPINHYFLHLVGLAFICLSKMHGQSSIKFVIMVLWLRSSHFSYPFL